MRATRWLATIAALAGTVALAQAGRPGTLLSAEAVAGAPAGSRAWRIHYLSSDDRGRPIAVTGMVVAPDRGGTGPRPVVAWTHGTWGVNESCAPSLAPSFFSATAGLKALDRGYVVVAPDYPGLGSKGPHPYLVKGPTARSTLDAVRAAAALPEARAGRRFALWGESQGGHAALATGEAARSYAPELQLVGIAAAAPPTELIANLEAPGNAAVKAFMTGYIVKSWSGYYGIPLKTIGGARTQKLIGTLAAKCVQIDSKPQLGMILRIAVLQRDLKSVQLGKLQPWARHARENSLGDRAAGAPVLIAQGSKDSLVAPAVTLDFARRLCRQGERVRYIALPGVDHVPVTGQSAAATLDWIDARFAGRPAPSDCGRF